MDDRIEFHEKAASSFDKRALELLAALSPAEPPKESENSEFSPDLYPVATINVILPEPILRVDPLEDRLESASFRIGDEIYELDQSRCRDLEKLAESIQRTPALCRRVSHEYVRKLILDWIKGRKAEAEIRALSNFLVEECQQAIESFTVWVPLAFLTIERGLDLGPLKLHPLSGDLLDKWKEAESRWPRRQNQSELDLVYRQKRSRIQGLAACVVPVRAERSLAQSKALELAEVVAALFRCLHPANLSPNRCFYCGPVGSEGVDSFEIFIEKESVYRGSASSFRRPMPERWDLGGDRLNLVESDLRKAEILLDPVSRTEFQTDVFDALMIYSRSAKATTSTDKLVFILVALESLLLKSSTEPIQSNVGERLAFTLGTSIQERQEIVALVRRCYGYRSAFVHHGKTLSEAGELEEFMMYTWVFFRRILGWHSDFKTREGFLAAIDQRRFA